MPIKISGDTVIDNSQNITVSGIITDNIGSVRSIPLITKTTSYQLIASDNGRVISTTSGITIPSGVFTEGNAVSIFNNSSSSITITATSVTCYLAGSSTTGNRTLAQRGLATIICTSANNFVIVGAGLT